MSGSNPTPQLQNQHAQADLVQRPLSRRSALGLLSGAVGTALLAPELASARGGGGSCTEAPAVTEGPYWENDSAAGFNRSDIRTNIDGSNAQDGIPLVLKLYIYDYASGSCTPLQGVQVDIWHCNAEGVYSDVPAGMGNPDTTADTYLRGYQISDANGLVTFTTVFPGWYNGRTTHIHLRLRSSYDSSSTGSTNTTQLFFQQAIVNHIGKTVSPYSSKGVNPMKNKDDGIYNQCNGETTVSLSGSASSSLSGTITLGVPLTAA